MEIPYVRRNLGMITIITIFYDLMRCYLFIYFSVHKRCILNEHIIKAQIPQLFLSLSEDRSKIIVISIEYIKNYRLKLF